MVPDAIADAKLNAKLNSIVNSEFFEGKAEEILSSVFHRAGTDDVIAVVDPPRAGLRRWQKKKRNKKPNLFSFN